MKKVLSFAVVTLLTVGLFSCEAENTAEQDNLYIDSPDTDVTWPQYRD